MTFSSRPRLINMTFFLISDQSNCWRLILKCRTIVGPFEVRRNYRLGSEEHIDFGPVVISPNDCPWCASSEPNYCPGLWDEFDVAVSLCLIICWLVLIA